MCLGHTLRQCVYVYVCVCMLVSVRGCVYLFECEYKVVYTCVHTSYEVSQDFYVGHQQQLKRITVLGILRPNYIRYKKLHNYINNHCKKYFTYQSFKWYPTI